MVLTPRRSILLGWIHEHCAWANGRACQWEGYKSIWWCLYPRQQWFVFGLPYLTITQDSDSILSQCFIYLRPNLYETNRPLHLLHTLTDRRNQNSSITFLVIILMYGSSHIIDNHYTKILGSVMMSSISLAMSNIKDRSGLSQRSREGQMHNRGRIQSSLVITSCWNR